MIDGLYLFDKIFDDKGEVVHEGLFSVFLESGADVCFAVVGMGFYDSGSGKVGVFFIEVVDLDFFGDKVVVIFIFDLFTIQIDDS